MPYIGRADEFDSDEIERLGEKVLEAVKGANPSLAAYVMMRTALAYWVLGGVTREQAMEVIRANAEAFFTQRTH